MFRILALVLCLGSAALSAQSCNASFKLTATGSAAVINNKTQGCTGFILTYTTAQETNSVSITVQSAEDDNGSPAAWVTFGGTVVSGTNPATTLYVGSTVVSGYQPWVRVLVGTLDAGSVSGTLRNTPYASAASAPAGYHVIDTRRAVTVTASGLTEILPGSMGLQTFVGHLSISGDSVINVKLVGGTGSNCGTGTFDISGFYRAVDSLVFDWGAYSPVSVPAGTSLCVNFSGASNWGGLLLYGLE